MPALLPQPPTSSGSRLRPAPTRPPKTARAPPAYASDWRLFARWCRRQGEAVGLYLAASVDGHGIDKIAVSTIERRLSAICAVYRSAGTPLDRGDRHTASVMAGLRRTHARPPRQKEALLGEDLLAMLATLPVHLRGIGDRATPPRQRATVSARGRELRCSACPNIIP